LLALNPISPDLWNTLGDSLFYLNSIDEAHEAFRQALALHPNDVRAHYNLVYTLMHRHDYASALQMIAKGLLHDENGEYRERFIERQSEILEHRERYYQQKLHSFINRFSKKIL